MIKKYSYWVLEDLAVQLVKEIALFGYSDGWSGSMEELQKAKAYMKKFNIYYADDMLGRWKVRGE